MYNFRNVLEFTRREQLRLWLTEHHTTENVCWVTVKKGRNVQEGQLAYLDAVEEALCFGWIDSTNRTHQGQTYQRFSPRKPGSPWSQLNIARCHRLERLGLMTEAGRKALPEEAYTRPLSIDPDIEEAFRNRPEAWQQFCKMPELYRRVRIDTIQRDKHKDIETFRRRTERLVNESAKGRMFGEWNDGGRLEDVW